MNRYSCNDTGSKISNEGKISFLYLRIELVAWNGEIIECV